MEQEAGPPYQFKLWGSVYIYPSQSSFYRMIVAAIAFWILGVVLVVLNGYLGIIAFAGFALMLYVLESGYRRGKELS
jgi:hypothetical protein